MILTGPEIRRQVDIGSKSECPMDWIDISPYDKSLVGPNSVDLRLHKDLLVYPAGRAILNKKGPWEVSEHVIDMRSHDHECTEVEISNYGTILEPGVLYLGRTIETIGSNSFVPIVEGRSSVGRLGIHVHVTAGFCDIGFRGTITLEIHVIHRVMVYRDSPVCQAYFLKPTGDIELYRGRYSGQVNPTPSRFGLKKSEYESK